MRAIGFGIHFGTYEISCAMHIQYSSVHLSYGQYLHLMVRFLNS